jgi:hypothetical protein
MGAWPVAPDERHDADCQDKADDNGPKHHHPIVPNQAPSGAECLNKPGRQ